MAMTTSMSSQSSIIMRFNMKNSQRFQIHNVFNPISNLGLSKQRIGSGFLSTPGLKHFGTIKINRDLTVCSSVSPGGDGSPSNSLRGWLVGLAMTIILPFFTHKWGPLLKWTKNIESVVESVEQITNTVESAAQKLHEVAENIEESLPQGKLRQTFDYIENTAEGIAKGADIAGDIIDKIQEVEDKVEALLEANETLKVAGDAATESAVAVSVAVAEVEALAVEQAVIDGAAANIEVVKGGDSK